MNATKQFSIALLTVFVGACAGEKDSPGKRPSSQLQTASDSSTVATGGLQLTQPDLSSSSTSAPIDQMRIDLYFAGDQDKPAVSQTVPYKPGSKISFPKVNAGRYRVHVEVLAGATPVMEGDADCDVSDGSVARAEVQLKEISGSQIDVVVRAPGSTKSKTACDFIAMSVPMSCSLGQFQCSVNRAATATKPASVESAVGLCGTMFAKRNLLVKLCLSRTPLTQAEYDTISCQQTSTVMPQLPSPPALPSPLATPTPTPTPTP